MPARKESKEAARQDYSLAAFSGDFAVLQEFLLEKESFLWDLLRLFDFLLRGFGQAVCANNPISGLLITISLAVASPGTLLLSTVTGFLGLLLSMLIRDTPENIANGITVCNPLLVGAVSYTVVPKMYGRFDAFSILLIILGTIFSVYMARAMNNNKSPYISWPFNLAEFALIFVLYTQDNGLDTMEKLQPVRGMDNATSDATTGDVSFIGENATRVHIDWGMIFHGVVVSSSQVFAVESVASGSIVYMAALICSPAIAGFAFLGALMGSMAGLTLGAQINEIYSGMWGYNTFLTGAALGGTFFAFNGQTVAATIVAIVYTVIVQYSILFFARNVKLELPVLSLPFILVTSLFLKLRNNSSDKTFPPRPTISFPERGRQDYLASQRILVLHANDSERAENDIKDLKDGQVSNI